MSSSNKETHTLTATTNELGVKLSVLDAWGAIHGSAKQGTLRLDLPRGLYTVRAERNGQYCDTAVRLTQSTSITPKLPARYSAIPLPGAATTHEYYTYSAWESSQNFTAAEINFSGNVDSAFMLFIRAPEQGKGMAYHQTEALSLMSLDGQVLSHMNDSDIRSDQVHGYSAFSAKMSAGMVILNDNGATPRQTLFPLLPGFQTQVYVMHLGRPLYEDMRVLTVPSEDISTRAHRDPYSQDEFADIANQVDVGMAALQNNVEDVGKSLVNNFLSSKFRNPILGLLGAYLVLLRRHQRLDKKYDDQLPQKIISNLDSLLPNSADVEALRYLASPWLGEPSFKEINQVPFFRVGAEVLIKAAARNPELIAEGCLFDVISDRILNDTAWTTWESISLPVESYLMTVNANDEESLGWVEIALADNLSDAKTELNVADLAERIGVTQRSLTYAFSKLSNLANKQPKMIEQEGLDASLVQGYAKKGQYLQLLESAATKLGGLLNDRAEDNPITFQGVYPALKSIVSEYSHSDKKITATDILHELVDKKKMKPLRDALFKKIKSKYPNVTLEEVDRGFSKTKTVRDLAAMLVKKKQL